VKSVGPLARVGDEISDHMDAIMQLFKPGAKITVIVRRPGQPGQDFIMSDDELEEAIACLRRRNGEPPDAR
jgi:hypothetical protein